MIQVQHANAGLDCSASWSVRNWKQELRILRRIGDKPVLMGGLDDEVDARAALEDRTRDHLIAQEEAEVERRMAAEAEEYRLDQEWRTQQQY